MAYGITTYKSDGTTVVLQPSTKTAVYGQAFTLDDLGTGYTRREVIPTRPAYYYYYKDFTEYTGRVIRPFQIRPGQHNWEIGITAATSVPYIKWYRNVDVANGAGISIPEFSYPDTLLYIFVR